MLSTCSRCGATLKDSTPANCIIIDGGKIICWACALSACEKIIENKGKIKASGRSAT